MLLHSLSCLVLSTHFRFFGTHTSYQGATVDLVAVPPGHARYARHIAKRIPHHATRTPITHPPTPRLDLDLDLLRRADVAHGAARLGGLEGREAAVRLGHAHVLLHIGVGPGLGGGFVQGCGLGQLPLQPFLGLPTLLPLPGQPLLWEEEGGEGEAR